MGILKRIGLIAALGIPAMIAHADTRMPSQQSGLLLASAQMGSIAAIANDGSLQIADGQTQYLRHDLDTVDLNGTNLAVESPDQRAADQGDDTSSGSSSGSGDVTPSNPNRTRYQDDTSSSDGQEAPAPRRVKRHYRHREAKVNTAAVVLGSIITAVGVVCLIASVATYEDEVGNASSTISWDYGGGYVDAAGTFTNTGDSGLTSSFVEVDAYNGLGGLMNYYDVSVGDTTPGDSYDWSLYNLYTASYPSGGVTATPYYTAYNYWGAEQDVLLIVGIACIAGGIVTLVSGLTHTEDAMSDNGVNLNVQASKDNQDLMMAASKSF
jgi:hypothetical protein